MIYRSTQFPCLAFLQNEALSASTYPAQKTDGDTRESAELPPPNSTAERRRNKGIDPIRF
jgi:hypothetical protein